ncbi:hypothetical protein JNW90_10550 [Micromonospora sp. STR1s_5]|nr:hypothetical protein [Micromonospora sp. STR1s_5]
MGIELHQYVVLITDNALKEIGQPITNWTAIEVERNFNEPDFGSVTVPADPALMAVLSWPGRRAVVLRDGAYYSGGPIERPAEPFDWTADADGADGVGEVTFTFASDDMRVYAHITLPNPALLPEDPAQPERWSATNTGERIILSLVNANCIAATGAVAYRKVPALVLGPESAPGGAGASITYSTRYEQMGDAVRRAALLSGGLGVRTVQTRTTVEFRVFQPVDRTAECRYSRSVGNLRGIHLESCAPSVTDAIVGGGGEGADRILVRRANTSARAAHGLYETFVDQRDTSDLTELNQSGDEAVAEGAETAKLTVVVVTSPGQPTPDVGDLVTVELWPGEELAQVVRSDHLEVDADGELLTLLVGSEDASPDPDWVREVRRITRSIGRKETT